jgi:hypothetical protein
MGRWLLALLLMSASLCAAVPDDQDIDVKVAKRSLEGADRLRRYGPVCFDIGIQQDHPQGGERSRRCAKRKSPLRSAVVSFRHGASHRTRALPRDSVVSHRGRHGQFTLHNDLGGRRRHDVDSSAWANDPRPVGPSMDRIRDHRGAHAATMAGDQGRDPPPQISVDGGGPQGRQRSAQGLRRIAFVQALQCCSILLVLLRFLRDLVAGGCDVLAGTTNRVAAGQGQGGRAHCECEEHHHEFSEHFGLLCRVRR